MTATVRLGRVVVSSTVASLAALETLAWAQAPAPAPEADRGLGIALALGVIALFLGVVVAAVKLFDRKRRREEDDMALEARVSDALMTDPALAGLPVTAHVERSSWSESSPTRVEVTGTVTSPAMEEAALRLVTREVLPARPGAHIESHLAVDPAYRRAA